MRDAPTVDPYCACSSSTILARHSVPCSVGISAEWNGHARFNRHKAKMSSILSVISSWLSTCFSEVQGGSNGQNYPASSVAKFNRHEAKMSSTLSVTSSWLSTCFSEVHGGSNGQNYPASSVFWFDSSVAVASDNDQSSGIQSAPTAKYVGAQHFGSTESTYSASTAFSGRIPCEYKAWWDIRWTAHLRGSVRIVRLWAYVRITQFPYLNIQQQGFLF